MFVPNFASEKTSKPVTAILFADTQQIMWVDKANIRRLSCGVSLSILFLDKLRPDLAL